MPEDMNLRNIEALQSAFSLPIGLSDHSLGSLAAVVAASLGVRIFEKHFTVDPDLPGWDHDMSADSAQLQAYIRDVNDAKKALGERRRRVGVKELEKRQAFRRSAVASRDLAAGEVLTEDAIEFLRPGTGYPYAKLTEIVDRTLKVSVSKGSVIRHEYFQ